MKNIYTYGGCPEKRNLTVYDLVNSKGKAQFTQVTASTCEEAKAAETAGIDILSCSTDEYLAVRSGAKETLIISALPPVKYISATEILRAAYEALEAGSDAIYTTRGIPAIEILAREDIPVMTHRSSCRENQPRSVDCEQLGKTQTRHMNCTASLSG